MLVRESDDESDDEDDEDEVEDGEAVEEGVGEEEVSDDDDPVGFHMLSHQSEKKPRLSSSTPESRCCRSTV